MSSVKRGPRAAASPSSGGFPRAARGSGSFPSLGKRADALPFERTYVVVNAADDVMPIGEDRVAANVDSSVLQAIADDDTGPMRAPLDHEVAPDGAMIAAMSRDAIAVDIARQRTDAERHVAFERSDLDGESRGGAR